MSSVVDLTVTAIADSVVELVDRVDAEPKADDVSRLDWMAVLWATQELERAVLRKTRVLDLRSRTDDA
jgi:hypothetical protein